MAGKKIMVIDDEPHILFMINRRLTAQGYSVITAADGQAGLDILSRECPDLILLDIMMPKMDGYEFLRLVKKIKTAGQIPIVAFTAKVRREDIDKAIALGAVDYIAKPFTPDLLMAKIRANL